MLLGAVFLLIAIPLCGQRFEVASVKSAAPQPARLATFMLPTGGPGTPDPGQLRWINVTLGFVLRRAFGLREDQVVAPKWMESEQFDIVAKVPSGSTKSDLMPMLQSLLVERFGLATHRERKELPVFRLVAARNGPRLREQASSGEFPPEGFPKLSDDRSEGLAMWATAEGMLRVTYKHQSVAELAEHLIVFAERPVIDATELKSRYDFTLEFAPSNARPAGMMRPESSDVPDDRRVTLFQAVQSQLGLRLEAGKAPLDILIVDHVERVPTGN